MKIFACSSLLVLGLSGLAFAGKSPSLTPALLEKGKATYVANCLTCHGEKGDGNGPTGKLLNPKPRDYATSKFKKGDKVEQIFATLTNGVEGTAMVGYKHLSEEDRWALAYYVKSFRPGASKDAPVGKKDAKAKQKV